MRIRPVDLAVILLYLGGITLFGVRFRRGQTTIRDYFLGGRSAPWWALAGSIVATETSTLTIIGTPGIAFAGNLGFLQLAMGYLVARVIICLLFIPQYFRGEFYTAYQLIEKRFGARTKSVAAATFLVTRALAEGVRINAIGKVVSVAFGTGQRLSVAAITALTLIYTFEGGMKAVIWTDVIQLLLYLAGSVTAFFVLLDRIPGGWMEVTRAAAAAGNKLRVFDFSFDLTQSYTFWSGVIGGTFLTLASHGTDQTMVQRLLAARSEGDSKKALLASGVIVFVQFTLFLLLGVMLFALHQHAALEIPGGDRDRIFPAFVVAAMPPGIAGLVLAAMFAVAMSNASGSLNSLASSSIVDFRVLRGADLSAAGADPAALLRSSRRVTLFWGAVLGTLGLLRWGPVLEAGLTIASITYGSMLGLFLLGILNRRATARGAVTGMAAGLALLLYVHFKTPLAWTWYVLVGTTATFLVGSLASLLDNPSEHSSEFRGKT
jgi:SSS family solute:Na+ symporter